MSTCCKYRRLSLDTHETHTTFGCSNSKPHSLQTYNDKIMLKIWSTLFFYKLPLYSEWQTFKTQIQWSITAQAMFMNEHI